MSWLVEFHDEFFEEFETFSEEVQDCILIRTTMLNEFGFNLGRPYVDTLTASKYPNMKELRFEASNSVWRVAFAFDPKRKAILLVAGDKKGVNQASFYKKLINIADQRFKKHLEQFNKRKK